MTSSSVNLQLSVGTLPLFAFYAFLTHDAVVSSAVLQIVRSSFSRCRQSVDPSAGGLNYGSASGNKLHGAICWRGQINRS